MNFEFITTQEAVEILTQATLKRTQGHIADLCAQGKINRCFMRAGTWFLPKEELGSYILTHIGQAKDRQKAGKVGNALIVGNYPKLDTKPDSDHSELEDKSDNDHSEPEDKNDSDHSEPEAKPDNDNF